MNNPQPLSLSLPTHNNRTAPPTLPGPFRTPGFRFVRHTLLLVLILASLILAAILLLSHTTGMQITVKAPGRVEPEIQHPVKSELDGLLTAVLVRQGQHIPQGAPVAHLDDRQWKAELEKINRELEVNQSRRVEIEQQIQREHSVLQAELERADAQIRTAQLRLEQIREEYTVYFALYPSRATQTPVNQLLPVRLREASLQLTEADRKKILQQLQTLDNRKQEIHTLEKLRDKLEGERRFLRQQHSKTILYSPASGTVLTPDLERRVGDPLRAGDTLLELAGPGAWQIRVLVRETDIARVQPGQTVRIYVNAFPHMEYGIFEGTVTSVPEQPTPESLNTPEPLYPVKATVLDPIVSDGQKTYRLASGMSVEARILIEQGTVLSLLWKKLLRTTDNLSRHNFYRPENPSDQQR